MGRRCHLERRSLSLFFFFFNDTATTEIYTLSLHDALPISRPGPKPDRGTGPDRDRARTRDRKSTRLNSSHGSISYAVFCLKKKRPQCSRRHPPQAQEPCDPADPPCDA